MESKIREGLKQFLEKCFVNGLPTAFQSGTHKVVENQSLLPYLCLILGDRLPKEYRKNMIDKLKCGRFITDHGFAENYNAVTGEGLRDRAYTWTSSGVFILAEEYLNSRA